ncbi:twin-arginine translocation signal domain-containing protein [Streptomyces sp. NPDC013457]|uniref:twin-arginine translocation signal domain-containing protein n=1 Tax=Streptomyces sp. NPDC013457 TaxID=3364866 RepID=UPI0036F5349A
MTIARRTFLRRAAVVTGTAVAGALPFSQYLASPAYAAQGWIEPKLIRDAARRARARRKAVSTDVPSRNGWEMEKATDQGGSIRTRPVPGTPISGVAVRIGEVETVLVHLIRRFHYEVDSLRKGDVTGWRSPGQVRKGLAEGNQASGTAVQIRPGHYPHGVTGGFFPNQELVIRDILAELDGVVRWGGDDAKADESLFYIDVRPDSRHLTQVAHKLQGWSEKPGKGAGGQIDITSPHRRAAARSRFLQQRTTT